MKRRERVEVARVLAVVRGRSAKLRGRLSPVPALFSVATAAREIGVKVKTLEAMVARCELATVRRGGRRLVPATEVRRLRRG